VTNDQLPPPDDATVGDVWFQRETYRFLADGMRGLADFVKSFQPLEQESALEHSPYGRLVKRIDDMVAWIEERLSAGSSFPILATGVSFGSLRLLKAGGLFAVQILERKRQDALSHHGSIPKAILAAIDEKIAQQRDMLEQGVFSGLDAAHIFFDVTEALTERRPLAAQSTGAESSRSEQPPRVLPTYLESIPILDTVLRDRCMPLIAALDSVTGRSGADTATRLDTVVREMSVVLEDRIRTLANLQGQQLSGAELMSRAVAGNGAILRFADHSGAQEAAHLLYRGYSGFVRNEVMHALVPGYTRERVIQLLGLVDYLLFLLSRAKRPPSDSPGQTQA